MSKVLVAKGVSELLLNDCSCMATELDGSKGSKYLLEALAQPSDLARKFGSAGDFELGRRELRTPLERNLFHKSLC